MAIVVLIFGGLLSILGIAGYIYGFDLLPTERGVASVIASSVVFVGGILAVAVGLVLNRMEELIRLLAAKPAAEAAPTRSAAIAPAEKLPVPAATDAVQPAPEPPKVAAVEVGDKPPVEKPAVAFDRPRPKPDAAKVATSAVPVPVTVPAPVPPVAAAASDAMPAKVSAGAAAATATAAVVAATLVAGKSDSPVTDAAATDAPPEPAGDPRKLTAAQRLDALTERLRAPLERPKIAPIELPKLDLTPVRLPMPEDAAPQFAAPQFAAPESAGPVAAVKPRVDTEVEYDVDVLTEIAPKQPIPAPEAPAIVVPMPPEDVAPTKTPTAASSSVDAARDNVLADLAAPVAKMVDPLADFEAELEKFLPLGRNDSKPAAAADAEAVPAGADVPAEEAPEQQTPAAEAPQPDLPAVEDATPPVQPEVVAPTLPAVAEPAPEAPKPLIPAPGAEVVGAYESGGAKYTMYSDGSVVAEAGGETLFFKSLEELREFIDGGVKA